MNNTKKQRKATTARQERKKEEIPLQGQDSTLIALLNTPFDPKSTRRVLEIRFPVPLYLLFDEYNCYRLIARPGLPGGHFQVGKLNNNRKEWEPAFQQDGLLWETKEERDCTLHQIHRRHTDLEIAFVQHNPVYAQKHGIQVVESIDRIEVTPMWGPPKTAYQTLTCRLTMQCGCLLYQQLQETKKYHWG